MDNQHRKITGYRELTQAEIDLMNEIKAQGAELGKLVEKVRRHVFEQLRATPIEEQGATKLAEPGRWANIGATDLQKGLMCLTRAVAQPTTF